jgi:P2-related tail formation protein
MRQLCFEGSMTQSESPSEENGSKLPAWAQQAKTRMFIAATLLTALAGVLVAGDKVIEALPSWKSISSFFQTSSGDCSQKNTFKERIECEQERH